MSDSLTKKRERLVRRRVRVRSVVAGTAKRPRLSVFRSLTHIYAQLIDDEKGVTLASAASSELKAGGTKTEQARAVGKAIAERGTKLGLVSVVFDRGGRAYHGRVKAVADAAREAGLKF